MCSSCIRKGRTLDLATCLVSGSGVLLIVSPTQTTQLAQRLQKYILFGDEVSFWVFSYESFQHSGSISCKLLTGAAPSLCGR